MLDYGCTLVKARLFPKISFLILGSSLLLIFFMTSIFLVFSMAPQLVLILHNLYSLIKNKVVQWKSVS